MRRKLQIAGFCNYSFFLSSVIIRISLIAVKSLWATSQFSERN